jgi:hypothetical protein
MQLIRYLSRHCLPVVALALSLLVVPTNVSAWASGTGAISDLRSTVRVIPQACGWNDQTIPVPHNCAVLPTPIP